MRHEWRLLPLFCLLWACPASVAQTLQLGERATGANRVEVGIGDTVEIEVRADLGRFSAAGVSVFIRVPEGPFSVVDHGAAGQEGVQPFLPGPLFAGAMEAGNGLSAEDQVPDMFAGEQVLSYSVVLGPGPDRERRGVGVVARFALRCAEPAAESQVGIYSSPVYETRLVLADGQSERRFAGVAGMTITSRPVTLVEQASTWGSIKAGWE